ncbi:MAG: hypothetical protein J6X78_01275 [Treponema sp.]|nr:hypothetical protein [Treponema sp.]
MKKCRFLIFCLFIIVSIQPFFAQSKSAVAANRKTAERCLSLSENFMLNNDWQNALSQAELGLSYDDTISDLFYVKAAAQSNLGYTKAQVIQTIKESFTKDNWVNYTKNSARILYADMLCDTGLYDESIAVLDMEPLLYSADSEFIRIKNYYRMGTADSISQARARLNSSRKIYPKDSRFPELFFMFEFAFMNYAERSGSPYEIPELVQTIADSYIAKIPDYNTQDVTMEIIALLFCQGEQQQRLLKAVGEKNQNSPLFAYAALKAGIITEEKAFNLFFEASNKTYTLSLLESFGLLLTDEALVQSFGEQLTALEGIVYIDSDLDLLNELTVTYERGRAKTILYDGNSDGVTELYATCDFGSPLSVIFDGGKINLYYDEFPNVGRVVDNTNGNVYHFLSFDYTYNPFEMNVDTLFSRFNTDFYIPFIDSEIEYPDSYVLARRASSVELGTKERNDSRVIYTVFEGRPVFAVFMNSGYKYAYATIEPGYPFVRYVDSDNDGTYETAETYDVDSQNKYTNPDDVQLIKNIFGENTFSERLYLKKVELDRNGDTNIEFSEQYLGNNGKISSFDSDGDGVIDYEYIRYPDSQDDKLVEETILYVAGTGSYIQDGYISLHSENGIPLNMRYGQEEIAVTAGKNQALYWVGQSGTAEQEQLILKVINNGLENGAVQLVDDGEQGRLTVIKIGGAYFCRILPPAQVQDEE